jgi:hypothetical protein
METSIILGIIAVSVNTFGAIMYIARKYIKKSSCLGNSVEFRDTPPVSVVPPAVSEWSVNILSV